MSDERHPLYALAERLRAARQVDLSQPFRPGIPRYPDDPDERRVDGMRHEETGFWTVIHTMVGAWGTHVDAPVHMFPGAASVDVIPLRAMVMPLVVLDISERAARDPDAEPTLEDVRGWETAHGRIPDGAFVALRTDWSKRWSEPEAFAGRDPETGRNHTPGWSLEVLRWLYESRGVTATGHETGDPEPGWRLSAPLEGSRPLPEEMHARYACEAYVLGRGAYQIECLANLDAVPEAGALVWVGIPRAEGCPNMPVRVIAICP